MDGGGGGRHSECHYFEVAPFHDAKQTNKKTIRLISFKMFSKQEWTKNDFKHILKHLFREGSANLSTT